MRKISFRHWLKSMPLGKTPAGPEGDFIEAAAADRNFPNVRSWNGLNAYLNDQGACREAIEAAAAVWDHYNKKVPAE